MLEYFVVEIFMTVCLAVPAMRVLVTGAFGNIGSNTIPQLTERGYQVRCFDLQTKRNEKTAHKIARRYTVEIIWGDIRSEDDVRRAVRDIDYIVHMAAILPPMSEQNPDLTWEVNFGGTDNIVSVAEEMGSLSKFIYTSSIATYGHSTGRGPPKTASDPQVAIDAYPKSKIEAEKRMRESSLPWTVLRLGAGISVDLEWLGQSMSGEMFHIPREQRIEFVHPKDVGLAITNALSADTVGKILLIAGGERCRMTYREFMKRTLETLGIGMLPDSAFIVPKSDEDYYHTDFMDTSEAETLLHFQTRTLDDYLDDLRKELGWRRRVMPLVRWYIRRRLLAASPYYKR
ncbi:MAG: NAD(P)-dependent oxidoreductase [Candidatus Thorarchaeota archaeon]|nr:MAG: NAD(P)-dependent oxidoreductase [Candidatus Thorarchaeota archaeon]